MHPKPLNSALKRVDALCREALLARRLDAFDNVDIDQMLAIPQLSVDNALWIGGHLMRNARHLNGYRAGQEIIRLAGQATNPQEASNAS